MKKFEEFNKVNENKVFLCDEAGERFYIESPSIEQAEEDCTIWNAEVLGEVPSNYLTTKDPANVVSNEFINENMFSNSDGSAISVKDMKHTPESAAKHLGSDGNSMTSNFPNMITEAIRGGYKNIEIIEVSSPPKGNSNTIIGGVVKYRLS